MLYLILLFTNCRNNNLETEIKIGSQIQTKRIEINNKRVKEFASKAASFIKIRNYNNQFCFLIDMSISSGKKRFFVYDSKTNGIITSGLVAHGSCNTGGLLNAKFSNKTGSGCTSLGKYKIGYRYKGRFGKSYKLYGLDKENSKAFERAVVLHSYECVPDFEMIESGICNSLGCPMVSPKFLAMIQTFIDGSKKPILLWIYK